MCNIGCIHPQYSHWKVSIGYLMSSHCFTLRKCSSMFLAGRCPVAVSRSGRARWMRKQREAGGAVVRGAGAGRAQAMNRSLPNVILGNWAAKAPSAGGPAAEVGVHQEIDAHGVAEVPPRPNPPSTPRLLTSAACLPLSCFLSLSNPIPLQSSLFCISLRVYDHFAFDPPPPPFQIF